MLRWAIRGFGNIPLAVVLTVLLMLQTSVVVGLAGYLCWCNGQSMIEDVAQQVGSIVVIPEADSTEYVEANTCMLLWALTGALTVALILGWSASHWLAQTISRFSRAIQAIAQGDLSQQVEEDLVIKELNGIAQSFNQMVVQLNRSVECVRGELQKSEEKFAKIFLSNPDSITISDLEEVRYLEVNDSTLQLLNCSREEIIGRSSVEFGLWVDLEACDRFLQLLQEQGLVRSYEAIICSRSGEVKTVLISADLIELDGKPCIFTVMKDISDHKRTQEALHQREQEFRAVVENAPDVISRLDRNYRFRYINPRIEVETGIPASEWIGKTELEMGMPASIVNPWHEALEHVFETGQEHIYESEFPSHEGIEYWICRMAPELAEDGSVETVLVVSRNITERKRAEEALWESNHLLQAILDSTPFSIFVKDMQGRYVIINPAVEKNIGTSREQIIGKTDYELLPEDIANQFQANDRIVLESGDVVEQEEVWYKGGSLQTFISTKFPLYKQDGSLQGVGGIAIDVTERKRIEAAREQAEEKIKASLKEKEILLKEIHHRVKNNLQIVMSLLSLQSRNIDDERIREIFKESRNRIRVMALTHEKLYQSISLAKIDFATYISRLVKELMFSYGVDSTAIELKIQVETIDLNIDTVIPCALIINELVSNALKYAFPTQSGEICIQCRTIANGQYQLIVSDNGVGLPEAFDISEASSLGLQLVQSLTQQLKGKMEVDRTNGTHFKITFSALS